MSLIYYSLLVRHVSGTITGHLQGAREFIDTYSLCGNLMRSWRISAQNCLSMINNNLNTVQQVINKHCTCSIFTWKMYVTFFRHICFQRRSPPPLGTATLWEGSLQQYLSVPFPWNCTWYHTSSSFIELPMARVAVTSDSGMGSTCATFTISDVTQHSHSLGQVKTVTVVPVYSPA